MINLILENESINCCSAENPIIPEWVFEWKLWNTENLINNPAGVVDTTELGAIFHVFSPRYLWHCRKTGTFMF